MKNCKNCKNKMDYFRIKEGKIYCSNCETNFSYIKKFTQTANKSKILHMSFGYLIGRESYDLKKIKELNSKTLKQILLKNNIT